VGLVLFSMGKEGLSDLPCRIGDLKYTDPAVGSLGL
jgi:hypothetical protein